MTTARGFKAVLDRFCDWREANKPEINIAVIEVREGTARLTLKIPKKNPLRYRGLSLKCIGSKRYRNENGS